MPLLFQQVASGRQRPDYPVHLRRPGVSDERDALQTSGGGRDESAGIGRDHAAACSLPATGTCRAATSSGQCSSSIVPSKCSTNALHPSTQSPSL